MREKINIIYENPILFLFIWGCVINLIAFVVAALDKRAAIKKKFRVPEKRLILFSVLGGGIGILTAFYLFRHKTRHGKLLLSIWFFTVIEAFFVIYLFYSAY